MADTGSAPLYDNIGVHYDATRRPDTYIADRLAHHLLLDQPDQWDQSDQPDQSVAGDRFIDIACGTGNYTNVMAGKRGRWNGLDLSAQMLRSARQKSGDISLYLADAVAMPFQDRSFGGALCTMALHHFAALPPVFREAYRVIDRGRFVIFTATSEQMQGYWLNEYFPNAMAKSMSQMPALSLALDALGDAGFRVDHTEQYEVRRDVEDFFLYSGKHHPEAYLSETVRRGISTFSTLADPLEIASGCGRLQGDIASGRIDKIMESYWHDGGDYLFVVSSKTI